MSPEFSHPTGKPIDAESGDVEADPAWRGSPASMQRRDGRIHKQPENPLVAPAALEKGNASAKETGLGLD